MYDLQRVRDLVEQLGRQEAETLEAQERLAAVIDHLKGVERQYEACKQEVMKTGIAVYKRERRQLEAEIVELRCHRKALYEWQKQAYEKMLDLRERGDTAAAWDSQVYAEKCHDQRRQCRERVDEIRKRLAKMRPPRTNYDRWLDDRSALKREYDWLRGVLKAARNEFAEARQALEEAKAAEAYTYGVLLEMLERYDQARRGQRTARLTWNEDAAESTGMIIFELDEAEVEPNGEMALRLGGSELTSAELCGLIRTLTEASDGEVVECTIVADVAFGES